MKNKLLCLFIPGLVMLSCNNNHAYQEEKTKAPVYYKNTAFQAYEDLSSPKFEALKIKYRLDTVFHGEQDEFKRILLLRNWISGAIKISDFEASYPGEGYAEKIIDAGLKGQGFHCGHYMIVQNAIMNAYGYITRCLGAGPGVKGGPDWHHGINEIWSNTYQKWFLSDAKYNHHFEKKGIPLSALEIRDEYLKNKASDIVLVKGPRRSEIEYDSIKNGKGVFVRWYKKDFAQAYTWIEWEKINNRFTGWPANSDTLNILNMYADSYFDNNTWIWDGKPHWAYHTRFMVPVGDRNAIEWTPNTIVTKVNIDKNIAHVKLSSNTPNFKTYQVKNKPDGEWRNIADSLEIPLEKERYEIAFRCVNLADVTGPESNVVIKR